MSLILFNTFLAGLLATKFFLVLHVNEMFIRYPLAVLFSYLVFFVFIKLWLWYLQRNSSLGALDFVDVPVDFSESVPASEIPLKPGGGEFGGAGATGSFEIPGENA